jgi:hypothetical protein
VSNYFLVRPDVAGGLGPNTKMNQVTHPPRIQKLHFVFDDWENDGLVTTFPCYLVTSEVAKILGDLGASGYKLNVVEVTTSEVFHALHPKMKLPTFHWLEVYGLPCQDDIGLTSRGELVMACHIVGALVRDDLLPNAHIEPLYI